MLVMRGELFCKIVSIEVVWIPSSTPLSKIKGRMEGQTDTSSDIIISLAAHCS